MRPGKKWMVLFALGAGCGPSEPEVPKLPPAPAGVTCESPQGTYDAVFTLEGTEGSCDAAKAESHDPMAFDGDGQFVSPAEGVVNCLTVQEGCRIAVRCVSAALDSRASLDAELSPDGTELRGVGVVEGSYQGCRKVIYQVMAVQDQGVP